MGELPLIEIAEILMDGRRTIFRFEQAFCGVDDRHLLKDCFCFDLHIPVYVEKGNWPAPHGPAHPGVFEDAFPAILSQLVGPGNVLTLHLEAVEPRFFDELTFIREVLVPRRLDYVLLPPRPNPQYPKEAAGNLMFEWPLHLARDIVDQWFKGFLIEVEGYVSRRSCLGELAKLYFQPYNASTIRELLTGLEFGFKLWLDNNGLFILSDKLPEEEFKKRLMDPNLDATIRTAIRNSTGQVWSRPGDVI
jgi:hypothetical protein